MKHSVLSNGAIRSLTRLCIDADSSDVNVPIVLSRALIDSAGTHLRDVTQPHAAFVSTSAQEALYVRSPQTCSKIVMSLLEYIGELLESCDYVLSSFKLNSCTLATDVELEIESLGVSRSACRKSGKVRFKERCVKSQALFARLECIVSALHMIAATNWPPAASKISETILRTLARAYKAIANALVDHARIVKLRKKLEFAGRVY